MTPDFDLFSLNSRVGGEPIQNPFGAVLDPSESYRVNSLLPRPLFAEAARDLRGTGAGQDVFLWEEGEQKALGKVLSSYKQLIGSCVSMGWARAAQDCLLLGVVAGQFGLPETYLVATEPIYAGSRVEVGKGRLGNGDGSLGSWAAVWVSKWGILLRTKYEAGKYDFAAKVGPDGSIVANDDLAGRWGMPRAGVPDDIEDDARLHPIKSVAVCQSFEEARDAIANKYPVPVASNQGFAWERTKDGFCKPEGSWAHQMLFRGCGVAKGNKPFLVCQNSWADYLKGNDTLTLESGKEVKLPAGAFAVDAQTANKMLRRGDSHVASNFVGFPRQKPDFDIFKR
jgi:hypothetical protein